MDAASVHWIYNNGIDYEEDDPLPPNGPINPENFLAVHELPDVPPNGPINPENFLDVHELPDVPPNGPIHPENFLHVFEFPDEEAVHVNPPDEEAALANPPDEEAALANPPDEEAALAYPPEEEAHLVPDDQQSFSSSDETVQDGSDEEFDEEDIPLISWENGYKELSSSSSYSPESPSDTNLSYDPATHGAPSRIASEPSVEDGAGGGNINEAFEESSELSDFTASVEASGEAEAAGAGYGPGDIESRMVVRRPGPDSPPPVQEDRAEVFLKLGCIVSIFLIGCIAVIAMSIEGYLSYDFLIIGTIFFFVLLTITISLFIIVCYYADMDAKERASGGGNRRREFRLRPDDPRAREFRYIPFFYRGP